MMATTESIKNKGEFIKKQTAIGSVTNEVVGQQFVDVSEVLEQEIAGLSKLGVLKTYSSFSAMENDKVAPVGDDGDPILHGQLVAVSDSTTPDKNGLYSYSIKDGAKDWVKRSDVSIPTDTARKGGYEGTLKDLDVAKAEEKVNGKSVVYATGGDIKTDASFLASETNNGLITKEGFNQIELNKKMIKYNTIRLNDLDMVIKDLLPPYMRFTTKIKMAFHNDTGEIQYGYGALRFNVTSSIFDGRIMLVQINNETCRSTMTIHGSTLVRHAVVLPVGLVDYNIYSSDIASLLCSSDLTKMKYFEITSSDPNFTILDLNAAYGTININRFATLKKLIWGGQLTQKIVDCTDSKELLEFNGAKNKYFVSFYFDGSKIEKIDLNGCLAFTDMLTANLALKLKEVDLSGTAAIIETLRVLDRFWTVGNNGKLKIDIALHTQLINQDKELFNSFGNKGITIVPVTYNNDGI